ncbi:MAG: metallophosphoesterase [Polyangiaceae bacterium]
MRLLVLSDLHIELAPFESGDVEADVVVLAGDIGPKLSGLQMAQAGFPDRPVIYVAGNHEYYGAALPHLTDKLRDLADGTNVHFLERDEVVIGSVRFLGCTLWTDFELYGEKEALSCRLEAEAKLNDYRRIRLSPRFRKLRTADTLSLHNRSLSWLEDRLAEPFPGKTVVVTHHAPGFESISPWYRGQRLSSAYASDLTDWASGKPIDLWIHGHTHNRLDYELSGIRVVANQRGYADEPVQGFESGFTVELDE